MNKIIRRITVPEIKKRKQQTPLVCLTAATAPIAKIADKYADLILVGDSLGMVLYNFKTTLKVSLEMMITHAKAVVDSTSKALIAVDMPFSTYEESANIAYKNAATILAQSEAQAVKLEGARNKSIEFLANRNIPVIGHIGVTPQSVHAMGGYQAKGKNEEEKNSLIKNAIDIENAGAFAIVIENVLANSARAITQKVNIPTIGIGASEHCDGQILVTEDIIGLSTSKTPKFVKTYANTAQVIDNALKNFSSEVKNKIFPQNQEQNLTFPRIIGKR